MQKKTSRQIILVIADVFLVNIAYLLALFLHYEGHIPDEVQSIYLNCMLILTIGKILIYQYFQLYNSLWSYASVDEFIKILIACFAGTILGTIYLFLMGERVFFGIYLTAMLLEIAFVGGTRFSYRVIRSFKNRNIFSRIDHEKKILIIGSGATATLIATEIRNHTLNYGQVIGFVDDDESKLYKTISGVTVLGSYHDIYGIVHKYKVNEIIIAVPTAGPYTLKMIIEECKRTSAKVRIMPGIREVIDGHVSLNKIRGVEIEDLLGRESVNLHTSEIISYIEHKTVLITGGGGSIGSELCRQIAKFNPEKLIILDNYENNAYEIQNELIKEYGDKLNLDIIIASVRDRCNMFSIIGSNRPDVIFHAAAHKHVPLMEHSPREAIKNNVFGTKNVAEAAHEYGVERFVLISTDKAVNPTNIMGASKRICEMIIQGLAKQSSTKFTAVRFGNVLDSNGSVVPLFKKQIREGGPITVTHKDIIRYFMTIPEAAQLVIQSGAIAKGGEIFVLDMGEPIRIYDLAVDLIRLSGLKLDEDIKIEITGLRPGEKLYEEMLMNEEGLSDTTCEKIHIGKPMEIDYIKLSESLDELLQHINSQNSNELIDLVKKIVPTFRSSDEVNLPKIISS